jgi:hypothetical protein
MCVQNPKLNHQGYLLHTAKKILSEMGFDDVRIHRLHSHYVFKGDALKEACTQATEELVGLWYHDDANYGKMMEAVVPHIQDLFADHPGVLQNQLAILVARPSK